MTASPTDCACRKKSFRYEIEAHLFAEKVRTMSRTGITRVYRCHRCNDFHITTKPLKIFNKETK